MNFAALAVYSLRLPEVTTRGPRPQPTGVPQSRFARLRMAHPMLKTTVMKPETDPFESIDLEALDGVNGGRKTSSSQLSSTMLTLLTTLESSLAAITQQQSNPV